jgi:hypothetical protein
MQGLLDYWEDYEADQKAADFVANLPWDWGNKSADPWGEFSHARFFDSETSMPLPVLKQTLELDLAAMIEVDAHSEGGYRLHFDLL